MTLPRLLTAQEQARAQPRPRRAKSVIMLYLLGGAPTQDMVDLKPNAPTGIRSQFRPIPTSAPGVQVCEHLPRMAKWMHRIGQVRSLNHKAGCHNYLPSYSGCEALQLDQHPHDSDPPSMGSVCEYLRASQGGHPDGGGRRRGGGEGALPERGGHCAGEKAAPMRDRSRRKPAPDRAAVLPARRARTCQPARESEHE